MNSEEIVQHLLKYVANTGKMPELDEPELENLMPEVIIAFGSLDSALRVAGLISDNSQQLSQKGGGRFSRIRKPTARPQNKIQSYPNEYFLNLLKLKRGRSQYPAQEGTPKWWERRSRSKYTCLSCHGSIERNERYIGRKTLKPGQKGIYGYRGTYYTHYFHIVCLLKEKSNNVGSSIKQFNLEIGSLLAKIADLKDEISSKEAQIETQRRAIDSEKDDYEQSSGLRRIGKWFAMKYKIGSMQRRIHKMQERIDQIRNVEIIMAEKDIREKTGRRNELQRYLSRIEADTRRLESA